MRLFILFCVLLIIAAQDVITSHCLVETDLTVGRAKGVPFTNRHDIIGQPPDLKLHSFINCIDEMGNMVGLQFELISDTGTKIQLSPVGSMTGNCRSLLIDG